MKKYFFNALVLFLVVTVANAQESSFQIGAFGGLSNPMGDYKSPIGRALNGYYTGVSLDYYFIEGMIGLGIDARMAEHDHLALDTISTGNAMLFSTMEGEPRFKHMGVFLGPTFQSYIGNLGLEFYGKLGMMSQKMPQHRRHLLFFMQGQPINMDVLESVHDAKSRSIAGVYGFRINYRITSWLGLFATGDYQQQISGQGYELRLLESQFTYPAEETPPGIAKVNMMNFGLGLRFFFGGSRNMLSEL